MNRRIFCLLIAVPLLASTAIAQPRPTVLFGGGVLVGVDAASSVVRIQQGGSEQRYSIAKDAEILRGKDRLGLADLDKATGHYLTLRYTEIDGTRVADRIKVTDRRPSSTSSAAPPSSTSTP